MTNYSVAEFRKKVAEGDHFLATVLKGILQFIAPCGHPALVGAPSIEAFGIGLSIRGSKAHSHGQSNTVQQVDIALVGAERIEDRPEFKPRHE